MTPSRQPTARTRPSAHPWDVAKGSENADQKPEAARLAGKTPPRSSRRARASAALAPRTVAAAKKSGSPPAAEAPTRGAETKSRVAPAARNPRTVGEGEVGVRWDPPPRPQCEGPRVWIDDPDPFFLLGVDHFLKRNGVVVAGQSQAFRPRPDLSRSNTILLFDLSENWVDLAARIVENTTARLVGIATRTDEELASHALAKGLRGLLLRDTLTPQTLLNCLRTVADGNTTLPSCLMDLLLAKSRERMQDALEATQLTPRELNVLERLAEGDDTRQVAKRLCYAERTVKNIIHDILLKLHCNTRAHAVALASRKRLI